MRHLATLGPPHEVRDAITFSNLVFTPFPEFTDGAFFSPPLITAMRSASITTIAAGGGRERQLESVHVSAEASAASSLCNLITV